MTYTLNEIELKNHINWVNKIPKKYKKFKFKEWFMFASSSGIGIVVNVRREYNNGDILNCDVTDYGRW